MSRPTATGASDEEIVALLQRYRCPVPFHEVRTRFLGRIASPLARAAPMEALMGLWGGEMPRFDDLDAVNALFGALLMGLWNRLTDHRNSTAPFRLVPVAAAPTREGVARFALIRRQEIDGFLEGLFGDAASMDLPQRAHEALTVLAEVRSMMAGIVDLLADPAKPATPEDLAAVLRNLRDLSKIIERELHEAVLSCAGARRQRASRLPAMRPTRH